MKQILFLTVQELKDSTPLQSNLDEKVLNQCIQEYQDLELQPLLGKDLFQRLSNTLVSGATISGYTYSDEDSLLLDYIKPIMVYGALLFSITPISLKVTNKGVQKLTDANAVAGASNDIEALKSAYTTKLDGYKKRLIDLMNQEPDIEVEPVLNAITTLDFTGIAIEDNTLNPADYWDKVYNKTGYARRIFW